jgi:hypothetical protein
MTADQTVPTGRAGARMAYDPVREKVVMYGGSVTGNNSDEVWELSP